MAYSVESKEKKGFVFKLKNKIGKIIAKTAPHNSLRVWGVKMCGFEVGKKVYIGSDLIIASMNSEKNCFLHIGNRVAIAPRVTLVLSSDANWSNLMNIVKPIRGKIILQDDCWLGSGVIVLPGVTIGECAIVGAGSVVTKDVPPYTVVADVPAKFIKKVEL